MTPSGDRQRGFHEDLVQRLFAAGMGLRAVMRLSEDSVAAELENLAAQLDAVINDVRRDAFAKVVNATPRR